MKLFRYILIGLTIILASCGNKVKPQAPANQQVADTATIALMERNMRLAEQADKVCTAYVQTLDTTYTLSEYGFWYICTHRTEGTLIHRGDKVHLIYRAYTLDGTLIEDAEVSPVADKRETLYCVDMLISWNDVHEGEEFTLVVPYYGAYGATDTPLAPAYTNCLVTVSDIYIEVPAKKR